MTQAQLALLVGGVLSLAFTFVPFLKDWFDKRTSSERAQVMAILIVAVGIAITALSCANILTDIPCTREGVKEFLLGAVVNSLFALSANQATHQITKEKSDEVKVVVKESSE